MRATICVKIIINTFMIFLISITIETKRPAYRKDYRYEKAFDAFYKLHHTAVDWHRARIRCEAEGAELVVPETLDESDALMLVISPSLNKFEGVFIGVHDIYAEGLFVTINGDFFANTFMELLWEQLQPKQGDGRCVGMRRNGKLFVHDCLKRLPFVCKKRVSQIVFYPDCVTFDKRWVLGPNNTCYMTHTEQQTWYDAFDTCAGAGGHLATLDTKNETDYIASLFNQVVQPVTEDDFAFLGFNDFFIRFHYRTVFGDPLGSQPADWDTKCADKNDLKNVEERCGGISRTGLLTTSACETPAVFFCKKPANDSSAVQVYTTAESANIKTLKTTEAKAIDNNNNKVTSKTPAGKRKNKLRNLDRQSHALDIGTRQAVKNLRVHAEKPSKTVTVVNSYTTKAVDGDSMNDIISTKAVKISRNLDKTVAEEIVLINDNTSSTAVIDTTQALHRSRVHANETNKIVDVLNDFNTTKAAIDINTHKKTEGVLRNIDTTLATKTVAGNEDVSKVMAVVEFNNTLIKKQKKSENEDTILPTVNRYSADVDISSTLKRDSVHEDTFSKEKTDLIEKYTSPSVKTDLVDEGIIPLVETNTQTEESVASYPFL